MGSCGTRLQKKRKLVKFVPFSVNIFLHFFLFASFSLFLVLEILVPLFWKTSSSLIMTKSRVAPSSTFALAFLFFFSAFVVGDSDTPCKTIGFCDDCTSTPSTIGNCRWCPSKYDNQCHSTDSPYNACPKSSDNIKHPGKCPPRPNQLTDFSPVLSTEMTAYAFATYDKNPCDNKYLPSTFTNCQSFSAPMPNSTETVVSMIGYDSSWNMILIGFRGTVCNWKNNCQQLVDEVKDRKLVPMPGAPTGVTVNSYFGTGALLLKEAMGDYSVLIELMEAHPTAHVYIAGHSLGGAMASIVALDLMLTKTLSDVPPTVYTYGQPRTGNNVFANTVNKLIPRVYRVVNRNDAVPHILACAKTCRHCNYGDKCSTLLGPMSYACCNPNANDYYHCGTEIWFPGGEQMDDHTLMCEYRECLGAPAGEDSSCSNRYVADYSEPAHGEYVNVLPNGYCCGLKGGDNCNPVPPFSNYQNYLFFGNESLGV